MSEQKHNSKSCLCGPVGERMSFNGREPQYRTNARRTTQPRQCSFRICQAGLAVTCPDCLALGARLDGCRLVPPSPSGEGRVMKLAR